MSGAILQSSFRNNAKRYFRSKSLWLMLLAAPIAARFMISQKEGEGISITIGSQLPVLTSPVLGIWLGIVVSVIVMPIAYIYLRASTTRRQPWQVEEVTAANRVSIALGRFFADSSVLLSMLAMLSLAGLFLGWLMVTGPWQPVYIISLLWLVAAPTFFVVAAIRILFDALPWLRGALGDTLFFVFWIFSIAVPSILAESPSTLATSMVDIGGAIRPLIEGAPAGSDNFAIGSSAIKEGRIDLDVFKGIAAEGYLLSRFAWVFIAIAIAAFAGLIYRPHRPKMRKQRFVWLSKLSAANLLPKAQPSSTHAGRAFAPAFGVLKSEIRLIASGKLFPILAIAAAIAGLAPDFRHIGSPAAILLLAFALSAHAGRSEAKGLLALTGVAAVSPWLRRAMFVLAGTLLSIAMAIPAIGISLSIYPLVLAATTGAAASIVAIGLASVSGSAFVARLVLLIGWYVYFAS